MERPSTEPMFRWRRDDLRPRGLQAAIARRLAPVLAVVGRARRRLWWQITLERLGHGVFAATGLIGLWALLARAGHFPSAWDGTARLALATVAALWLAWTLGHRARWNTTARLLDERALGRDQLSTALWLGQTGRQDAWAEVQAATALEWARHLDVPALLPARVPPAWRKWLVGLAILPMGLALPVTQPLRRTAGLDAGLALDLGDRPQPLPTTADVLGPDDLDLIESDLAVLREIARQVDDPETRQWLTELAQVLQAVQQGRLDKREALQKLAELEARKPAPSGEGTDPLGLSPEDPEERERQRDLAANKALQDAAKAALLAAPDGAEKELLKKAVEEGDLAKLANLAEKLADKRWSDDELKKWAKALDKFADALKDRKVPKQLEELAKRIQRLQDKRDKEGGLNRNDQERLRQARHEAQQLRRQEGDTEAAKHQVERLERGARNAADELRREAEERQRQAGGQDGKDGARQANKQDGEGGQQDGQAGPRARQGLRQAADELRRESEGQKSRQAQRIGRARMRDVRDALDRAGQSQRTAKQGQNGQQDGEQSDEQGRRKPRPAQRLGRGEKGDGEPQDGEGQDDEGQQGEGEGQDGDGEEGSGRKRFQLGRDDLGDKGRMEVLRETAGRKSGSAQGRGGSQAGTGPGSDRKDGKASKAQAARTEHVQGEHGEGEDTKKVFRDAARKGFSRQGWRQVYVEYSEVAEEMLEKEQLPAGRRRTVQRYFEVLRPK